MIFHIEFFPVNWSRGYPQMGPYFPIESFFLHIPLPNSGGTLKGALIADKTNPVTPENIQTFVCYNKTSRRKRQTLAIAAKQIPLSKSP